MPRVHHVKKALKDHPTIGVKKGEPYYWWEFRAGGKQMSKTAPRASQLTSSDKLSRLYAIGEDLEDAIAAASSPDEIEDALNNAASDANELAEEYRDSIQNMPEGLQQGSTAEDMEAKADALESFASECDDARTEVEGIDAADHGPEGANVEDFASLSEQGQAAYMDAAREACSHLSVDF